MLGGGKLCSDSRWFWRWQPRSFLPEAAVLFIFASAAMEVSAVLILGRNSALAASIRMSQVLMMTRFA